MVKLFVDSSPKTATGSTKETVIHVLYVDDEAGCLKATKQILEMQGSFKVDTALSVKEAQKKLNHKAYDVIVSDYLMPERNGLDFLKELKDRGNDVPFILFTGKGREEVAIEALNLGADRYCNKIGNPEAVYGELAHSLRNAVKTKRAERMLRESEEKYRRLVELSPDGIVSVDTKGRVTSINKAALNQAGMSENEILGKHFTKLKAIRTRDLSKYIKLVGSILRGKIPDIFEFVYCCKDGTQRLGEARISIMKEKGKTIGVQAILRDITDRKQAEEALQESEKKYRGLFENAHEVIVLLNLEGNVTSINKAAVNYGLKEDEIIGKNITEFVSKKDWPRLLKDLVFITRGKSVESKIEVKTPQGKRLGEYRSNPIIVDNKVVGIQVILRDITERKKAEEELQRMMEELRMVNEKLSVVGELTRHDTRNKLSVITNNLYLTKQKLADDPKTLEYLGEIESAVGQIEKIFDFARTYEMLGVEGLSYVDAEKSVEEAAMLFSELNGTKLVNECHGLTVLADSLLRQLFYNLIDNTLKHGEEVSQIRIYYREGKNQLKLVYEDDGIGIPEDKKEKVFREGYGKGTGYGLYLIRKICEAYDWTIQETGIPGKGAQFTITVPKTNNNGKVAYQFDKELLSDN